MSGRWIVREMFSGDDYSRFGVIDTQSSIHEVICRCGVESNAATIARALNAAASPSHLPEEGDHA